MFHINMYHASMYVCMYVLWHVDTLVGNNREISNYTTTVAK
jgi:hypothetical protein